ncbi:c-type cytochrome [Variovorax rhizosphaerae]|uniref:C-type cytochrome n=1 Tax=Variovorax rhizosphaerae TaxID=1836200 RepID=A0ABU8WSX3_9BURK
MWRAVDLAKRLRAGQMARYAAALFLALSGELGTPEHIGRAPAPFTGIDDPAVASAWQALRTLQCERCHGQGYEGLSAPSIVEFARTQDHAAFVRTVLDGNGPRGMPAYRGNPLVDANIEGIYRYFAARADGSIGPTDRPAARTASGQG